MNEMGQLIAVLSGGLLAGANAYLNYRMFKKLDNKVMQNIMTVVVFLVTLFFVLPGIFFTLIHVAIVRKRTLQ